MSRSRVENRPVKPVAEEVKQRETEDHKGVTLQVTPSRSRGRTEKKRIQQKYMSAAAKWFLAAALVWMSYIAVRRFTVSASRKKPVSLTDGYDLEQWAEAVLTNNTIPPLKEVVPESDERLKLLEDIQQLWEALTWESDLSKRARTVAKLYGILEMVRERVAMRQVK